MPVLLRARFLHQDALAAGLVPAGAPRCQGLGARDTQARSLERKSAYLDGRRSRRQQFPQRNGFRANYKSIQRLVPPPGTTYVRYLWPAFRLVIECTTPKEPPDAGGSGKKETPGYRITRGRSPAITRHGAEFYPGNLTICGSWHPVKQSATPSVDSPDRDARAPPGPAIAGVPRSQSAQVLSHSLPAP